LTRELLSLSLARARSRGRGGQRLSLFFSLRPPTGRGEGARARARVPAGISGTRYPLVPAGTCGYPPAPFFSRARQRAYARAGGKKVAEGDFFFAARGGRGRRAARIFFRRARRTRVAREEKKEREREMSSRRWREKRGASPCFFPSLQVLEYLAHRLVTLYGVKKGRQEPNVKLHVLSQDIDPPLQSAFFPVSKLDRAVTQIVEGMELYLSSRQTLNLRHNFRIRVTIDRVPPISIRGGARGKAKKGSFVKFESSSKWSVTSRHVLIMPDIPAGEPLADCCLLLALTVGMAYAKEKRDNPVRGNLVKRPVNSEWKHYRHLNHTGVRARRAEEYLKNGVSAAAAPGPRRLAPNLAAFKTKSLDELVASGELDKFPANIFIYSQKANYRLLKQHPAVYDPTLPSIDILAVSLPDDEEEECEEEDEEEEADEQEVESRPASTESVNDVRHAALITDEKAFMRKRKARLCRYCGKSFSFIHFNVHKCPAAARCSGCLRIKGVLNVDWKDRLNEKDLCFGPPDASPPRRDQERGGEARSSSPSDEENAARELSGRIENRRREEGGDSDAPTDAIVAGGGAGRQGEDGRWLVASAPSPLPSSRGEPASPGPAAERERRTCTRCGIICRHAECLSYHEKECKRRGLFICPSCSVIARKKDHKCHTRQKQRKCRHCNEWFDPKLSKEGKHDCKLQKPRQPSFYDKICFWDVETTTDSEGRHSANAVGASFEGEQFGVFSEVTFYDDALRHPADAEFRHDVFYRQYWPDDRELTPRPIKKRWATNEGAADVEGEEEEGALSTDDDDDAAVASDYRDGGGGAEALGRPQTRRKTIGPGHATARELGGCLSQWRRRLSKKKRARRRKSRRRATSFLDAEAAVDDDDDEEEEEESEEDKEDDDEENESSGEENLRLDGDSIGRNGHSHDAQKEREDRERRERAGEDKALVKFIRFALSPSMKHTTFIAHNSAKFDAILLVEIFLKLNVRVETVFDGQKLLCLKVPMNDIRFIDSFRYIKTALEKFPSRFPDMTDPTKNKQHSKGEMEEEDEEGSLAKGMFPYKANRPEFYEYEGPVPSVDYFVDEFTSESKKRQAEAFVRDFKNVWNFQKQLHTYLMSDVRLLRNGCLSLIEEFFTFQKELSPTGPLFHPFNSPFFTLPSYVHAVWRYFGMSEASLYLIADPTNARKSSRQEMEWLDYQQHLLPGDWTIQTASNDIRGQAKRGPFFVDGWCRENGTAYEFLGCIVHGHNVERGNCPLTRHLREDQKNPFGRVYSDVHREWMDRKRELLAMSDCRSVVYIWECQWKKMKKEDELVRQFIQERKRTCRDKPFERLAVRQALRGGRVEPYRLVWTRQTCPNRRLAYVDKVKKAFI
jgi:hypothetical protein